MSILTHFYDTRVQPVFEFYSGNGNLSLCANPVFFFYLELCFLSNCISHGCREISALGRIKLVLHLI
jgi:hypothetical protein